MDSDSSTCAAADGSSSSNSIFCTNDDGIDPTTSTTVSPSDLFFYATIAFSTMSLSTILLMQLDSISRRLLSPERLLAYVVYYCMNIIWNCPPMATTFLINENLLIITCGTDTCFIICDRIVTFILAANADRNTTMPPCKVANTTPFKSDNTLGEGNEITIQNRNRPYGKNLPIVMWMKWNV